MAEERTLAQTMTSELWGRLKPLFHKAMEREPKDRITFVEQVCAESPELKEHLLSLIIAEQETTGPDLHFDLLIDGLKNETRFQAGELVLNRFRILRLIGWGGMGEVYQAEDLELGLIALKTIRNTIASSPAALERFRREVHLARKISGPQICRIHELFIVPEVSGHPVTPFLTMEFLEGTTLSSKLKKDGPIPLRQARSIALDICKGLELIHREGIIHRDLKSTNIMICQQAATVRTVLMDFGLARAFGFNDASPQSKSGSGWQESTVGGAIMGTPEYMAPEQFEANEVSPATDVYALGIILYELVTGTHPYPAHDPMAAAIGRAHRPKPASSLTRSLPRRWDRVIQRCLEYEPEKRYQSAQEVAKALLPGPSNLRYMHKDRPWATFALFAVALAIFIWTGVAFWRSLGYYRPNQEVFKKWYLPGVDAIRDGTYVKAIRSLQTAIGNDPGNFMAHARLAEAWEDLDFQGNAEREMLIAKSGERTVRPRDRKYLSAIQASILGDYQGAIRIYRQIAAHAAGSEQAPAHVDLGIAYERSGDPEHALAEYVRASKLDPDNAAAFMRIAVILAHQHDVRDSNKAFDHVETLYRNTSNQEGLAELDYERGYAANSSGDSAKARQPLEKASHEADDIPSPQLKIRTLTQLSSLAYSSGAEEEAISDANQAINLARLNQLESWAANGYVRLASAQLMQGDLSDADKSLQDAFTILHQSPQPRTEAFANFTLASLRNQQGLPDQVTAPAQLALDYYKRNGFFYEATSAAILILRAQRDKGQYQQALESANKVLALTKQSGVSSLMMLAEENTGSIYLRMELYPDALTHYRNALALSDTPKAHAYQTLHCGEVLWRLGLYPEAEQMLQSVTEPKRLAEAHINRVDSLLSQRHYKQALELANHYLADKSETNKSREDELRQAIAISEAHLGMKQPALEYIAGQPHGNPHNTPEGTANTELAEAEIYLAAGMTSEAEQVAAKAHDYFKSTSQKDSLLHSTLLEAAAFQSAKDDANYHKYFQEAIDTVKSLQDTWSPQSLQSYLARPDLQIAGNLR